MSKLAVMIKAEAAARTILINVDRNNFQKTQKRKKKIFHSLMIIHFARVKR